MITINTFKSTYELLIEKLIEAILISESRFVKLIVIDQLIVIRDFKLQLVDEAGKDCLVFSKSR